MKEQGARRRIKEPDVTRAFLWLVAATAVVFLHDVIVSFDSPRDALSGKWIGAGAAAGLLFTAITLYVSRQHFAAANDPYLSYVRGVRAPSIGLQGRGISLTWCVEVSSLGRGLAIIGSTSYDIELHDAPASKRENVPFGEMVEVLRASGLQGERDFVLKNWYPGFALMPTPDPTRLWEFPLPVANRIKTLTVRMEYQSRVGDQVELTIDAIPPGGVPSE